MADSFRDLPVWQKAMALVTAVNQATETFPARELHGLTNQVRRSAVSIPSNIAEGKGRFSKRELTQFLMTARGSLCEMQTQLEIAANLGYLELEKFTRLDDQSREVGRILNGLIKAVRVSPASREPRAAS
jgi:four helix bundle protein